METFPKFQLVFRLFQTCFWWAALQIKLMTTNLYIERCLAIPTSNLVTFPSTQYLRFSTIFWVGRYICLCQIKAKLSLFSNNCRGFHRWILYCNDQPYFRIYVSEPRWIYIWLALLGLPMISSGIIFFIRCVIYT